MSSQLCTVVLIGFLVVQCAVAYNTRRGNSYYYNYYEEDYTGPIVGVILAAAILTSLIVVICIVHRNKKRCQGREISQNGQRVIQQQIAFGAVTH